MRLDKVCHSLTVVVILGCHSVACRQKPKCEIDYEALHVRAINYRNLELLGTIETNLVIWQHFAHIYTFMAR